jgi:nuclease S1
MSDQTAPRSCIGGTGTLACAVLAIRARARNLGAPYKIAQPGVAVPRDASRHFYCFRRSTPTILMRRAILVCLLFVAACSLPAPARAWGCKGHQVVALLAEKHLTPHALAMAKKILDEGPIDPSLRRYCKEGGSDAMADASTWPDDYRPLHPETALWHYIDIPLGTARREVEKFCDPKLSCVTRAITDQLAILRAQDSDPQKKADALRFVIHFVGDLHQPLHAAWNNDLGGNCVPVAFFDETPQLRNPQLEIYSPNLHAVWDTNILERATTGKTVDQVAAELDQSFRKKIARWQKGPADVDSWAWESYQLAAKKVYAKLPVRIPIETPQPMMSCADDNHISARMLKLSEHLAEPYQNMAVPVVRERLAQAGARLALLLNHLWP